MTNANVRKALGWITMAAIPIFFVVTFFLGGSVQGFMATWLFSHLPLFLVIFWIMFRSAKLLQEKVFQAILWGWGAWLLCSILWEISYHSLYRRFTWPTPDLPGEFLGGILFGWIPAALVTLIAFSVKWVLDRFLPIEVRDKAGIHLKAQGLYNPTLKEPSAE